MRANLLLFVLFLLYFWHTRVYMVFWIRARYVCQCRLCNVHSIRLRCNFFLVCSNETCFSLFFSFSCDHLLWKSDNMHLVCCFFFIYSSLCTRQLPLTGILIFELKNEKKKFQFVCAQWIWTKSLQLQRTKPADWSDPWCVSAVFIFHSSFSILVCFVSPEVGGGSEWYLFAHWISSLATTTCTDILAGCAGHSSTHTQRRFITSTRI